MRPPRASQSSLRDGILGQYHGTMYSQWLCCPLCQACTGRSRPVLDSENQISNMAIGTGSLVGGKLLPAAQASRTSSVEALSFDQALMLADCSTESVLQDHALPARRPHPGRPGGTFKSPAPRSSTWIPTQSTGRWTLPKPDGTTTCESSRACRSVCFDGTRRDSLQLCR